MNLKNLYQVSSKVLLNPITVWEEIFLTSRQKAELVKEILLPFSLMVGICAFLGMAFTEYIHDSFSLGYVLMNGIISSLIIFLEVYLAGWLITEIASAFDAGASSDDVFNLVVFSQIPFILTLSVSKLFPSLIFLNAFGIYSFFLFWSGLHQFPRLKDQNKVIFMFLSVVIIMLLFLLITSIFNSIYDAILNRFTTFGA